VSSLGVDDRPQGPSIDCEVFLVLACQTFEVIGRPRSGWPASTNQMPSGDLASLAVGVALAGGLTCKRLTSFRSNSLGVAHFHDGRIGCIFNTVGEVSRRSR